MKRVNEDSATLDRPEACRDLTGLLIRPDGIIAWATETTDAAEAATGLAAALQHWAGESAQVLEPTTR